MLLACPDKTDFNIAECPELIFSEIVKYVYTDEIVVTPDTGEPLLAWAKKFQLDSLVARIEGKGEALTLVDDLEKLINSKIFSDVTFIVDKTEIPSHKLILEVRSEHFRRLFSSGLRESQSNRIEIFDCTVPIFLDVIRFIYTDSCDVNDVNCISLLEQANFFQLDRLKGICEQFWYHNISIANAANVLQVADHCNAAQLKDFAMEFIFKHIKEVVQTEAFKELDQSLVSLILIASVERSK